ncbi:hypothetical protein ALC56_06209, partial [Trachymyrmex septentrionalis]
QLNAFVSNFTILPSCQSSFRQSHSTTKHITDFVTLLFLFFLDSQNNDFRCDFPEGNLYCIASTIISRYHPSVQMKGDNGELICQLLEKANEVNVVQTLVEIEHLVKLKDGKCPTYSLFSNFGLRYSERFWT